MSEMFDLTAGAPRGIEEPAVFFISSEMEERYTGTTPSGREVTGRLEVEDGISYIVQVDADNDNYETWYMVFTSSVRKEEGNGE